MQLPDPDPSPPEAATRTGPPPLGISLSALILVGFMLMAAVGGISLIARGAVAPGVLTTVVSVTLVWVGWMLYRCHHAAWVAAVAAFAFLTLSWIAGAIVLGVVGALLYVPLFAAPLALLFLPEARAAASSRRR